MYPIDFNTATIDDVITRSITCHPSLLTDALRANASIHFHARDVMHDKIATECAQRAGKECRDAAAIIDARPISPIAKMTFGQRLAAFSAAARLQCVTPAVASDIAKLDDESRKVTA